MKTLHLLRHAKSSWQESGLDDFDRPLNKRGTAAARAMGRHMAEQGIRPDLVLCSAAARTHATLDLLLEFLGGSPPWLIEKGLYLATAAAIVERIRHVADSVASILVIGHNPGLHEAATDLAGEGDPVLLKRLVAKYPTAALATLAFPLERWSQVRPGNGRLLAFVRPGDLPDEA